MAVRIGWALARKRVTEMDHYGSMADGLSGILLYNPGT
jgi:hypothetical protein